MDKRQIRKELVRWIAGSLEMLDDDYDFTKEFTDADYVRLVEVRHKIAAELRRRYRIPEKPSGEQK